MTPEERTLLMALDRAYDIDSLTHKILDAINRFGKSDIPFRDIRSPKRNRPIVIARRIIIAILYNKYNFSVLNIGDMLLKDHSTVSYQLKTHRDDYKYNRAYHEMYDSIEQQFKKQYQL